MEEVLTLNYFNLYENESFYGADVEMNNVIIPTNVTRLKRKVVVRVSIPNGVWYTSFGTILTLAGNIMLIWVILAHKRMRTLTNSFLLNLGISDLLLATLNGVPNFISMVERQWDFGDTLCIVNNTMGVVTVCSCVFTMTAISLDRYFIIMKPLKPRKRKNQIFFALFLIWIISIILSSPYIYYSGVTQLKLSTGNMRLLCLQQWPDTDKGVGPSKYDLIYSIVLLIFSYIIPALMMGIWYGKVCKELWGHNPIGEPSARQIESVATKRKIVKMFICILVSFLSCWFFYQLSFIVVNIFPALDYYRHTRDIFLVFYLLAMSTSLINPTIVFTMNNKFRGFIKALFIKSEPRAPVSLNLPQRIQNTAISGQSRGESSQPKNPPELIVLNSNEGRVHYQKAGNPKNNLRREDNPSQRLQKQASVTYC